MVSWLISWVLLAAEAPPTPSAAAELRDGDIILHRGRSSQANAIIAATQSRFTHVGIIDVTPTGIEVIEAVGPVRRTPLAEFVARSVGAPTFVRHQAVDEHSGPAIVRAAMAYAGRPYDPYFIMDRERIYCSELVWRAYADVGLSIGTVQRFSDLEMAAAAVQRLLDARWRRHPLCKSLPSKAHCRRRIAREKIITPVGLTMDRRVETITLSAQAGGGQP